jgi:Tol biopolymer transport system component
MNDDRTLDRAARSWLEEGPSHAPDRALDAALLRIQSVPQERELRLPWRMPTVFTNRLTVAAAAVVLVVVGAGFALSRLASTTPGSTPGPTSTINPTLVPSTAPSPTAPAAAWHGKILVEHFGNAPDGSEQAGDLGFHRLYLVDPNNQTATGYTEFLPGRPAAGKSSADVSRDGSKVVFQDWADTSSIYIANIDGTGFRVLTRAGCRCREWDPAFNATATKVVYGHAEGSKAWLEILDLATNTRTKVPGTTGPSADNVVESPSWSPDGKQIAFVQTRWNGQESNMGLVHYDDSQTPAGATLTVLTLADGTTTTLKTGAAPLNAIVPGDPFFSPDGAKILFLDHPFSKMPIGPSHAAYTINPDGTGLKQVLFFADGANWTPDGNWILATYNYFTLSRADGSSGGGVVDAGAADNTENAVGYIYNGYWVGTP